MPDTVFEAVGGQPFFDALVERFYVEVERDEILRPMYPRELGPSKRRLALFLVQYWGGPPTYSEERGHPRLRMRHFPFVIDAAARDAWMRAMTTALDASGMPPEVDAAMRTYFQGAADWMVNQEEAAPDAAPDTAPSGPSGPGGSSASE